MESDIVLDGGRGGRMETNDEAAGRRAGYVIAVATSVSVTDERELTLLALDLTLDFALDLEVASADSFDFFSDLPLFSLAMLFASFPAFIDFLVCSETCDGPCGKLDFDL